MAYGDTKEKKRGIDREPIVAQRILNFFRSYNKNVTMQKAELLEDMKKHYDYKYTCDKISSFSKKEKITEINIDIKCAKTFTLLDENGNNTLENSESTFIVYETHNDADLIWINTRKLKECLKKYPPYLRISKQKGNNSKYFSRYFFIEDYIEKNREFLKNFVKYI